MKILILGVETPKVHRLEPRHVDQIQTLEKSIELHTPLAANAEEVQTYLGDAEVLAGFPRDLVKISIDSMPQLKWMHTFSAGMEQVLTPELMALNILVSNSSGVHAIPIAEYVLACALFFAKNVTSGSIFNPIIEKTIFPHPIIVENL